MNNLIIGILIGTVAGIIIGVKIAPQEVTNHIGKVKGNGGEVNVDQVQQEKEKKKKGFLKRIFTKKRNK